MLAAFLLSFSTLQVSLLQRLIILTPLHRENNLLLKEKISICRKGRKGEAIPLPLPALWMMVSTIWNASQHPVIARNISWAHIAQSYSKLVGKTITVYLWRCRTDKATIYFFGFYLEIILPKGSSQGSCAWVYLFVFFVCLHYCISLNGSRESMMVTLSKSTICWWKMLYK